MRTYYLNNSGHRFVVRENGRNIQVKLLDLNLIRRAKYFQMLGNSAYVCCSVKGKLIKTFNYEVI